jgi:hypothetical protein
VNTLCIEEEAEAEREREREVILFFIRRETLKIKIKNNLFSLYNVTNIIQIFIVFNVALRASERARERERERLVKKNNWNIEHFLFSVYTFISDIHRESVCEESVNQIFEIKRQRERVRKKVT